MADLPKVKPKKVVVYFEGDRDPLEWTVEEGKRGVILSLFRREDGQDDDTTTYAVSCMDHLAAMVVSLVECGGHDLMRMIIAHRLAQLKAEHEEINRGDTVPTNPKFVGNA